MGADLRFDTDDFQKAIDDYRELIDGMNDLKDKLQKELESLKSTYWVSEAGEKFQNQYESTWKKNVETYTDFLEHLKNTLDTVKKQYKALYDRANKLNIS